MTPEVRLFGRTFAIALTLDGQQLVIVQTGPRMWHVASEAMSRRILDGVRLTVISTEGKPQ